MIGKLLPLGYVAPLAPAQIERLMQSPSLLLVDLRFHPASRLPVWRQAALQDRYGERYIWLGEDLGNVNYKSGGPITIAHPASGVKALLSYVNCPRLEAGSFDVVAHVGSSQANQFDAYRQASCRSKKKLALCMARSVKTVAFLPTTLRCGTHRNTMRLKTCKRTDESIE
jgi:hypothetical protein